MEARPSRWWTRNRRRIGTPPESRQVRAIFDASPVAIIAVGGNGLVREWNHAARRLLGWDATEVVGHPLPAPELRAAISRALGGQDRQRPPVSRITRADGAIVDVEVSAASTRDEHDGLADVVVILVDVRERERLHRQLEHQAGHDPLTGLPNRAVLQQRLADTLAAAEATGARTGLLILDLDKFKEVNDTLGHASGDQLLAQVGPRLITGAIRGHDTVARLGGDEFAVLLPELPNAQAAVDVGERILAVLQAPFTLASVDRPGEVTRVDVAVSVGVALAPDHAAGADELLHHADVAMYEAKETTAGVAVYQTIGKDERPSRFVLLGELRRALTSGELVAYYQPKINIADGKLVGVEALARWNHPDRGLIGPDEFIPIAETTGLILPLTDRILDLALAQAHAWAEAGRTIPVAVNLSARCLHDAGLPDRIHAAMARHHVPADLLCLEITESAIMHDPTGALTILHTLADAGIRLSLDDFGTGYSSMSYLRQLPVVELKVDRMFVLDLTATRPDAVLVHAAVNLAHNLGLTVVAEGVEDAPTLDALDELGADTAQGYHFSRPLPPGEFDTWLADYDPDRRLTG